MPTHLVAWGAGELRSPRTVAGGRGRPFRVTMPMNRVRGARKGMLVGRGLLSWICE